MLLINILIYSFIYSSCNLPTKHGNFKLDIHKFKNLEIPVLYKNNNNLNDVPLVRIHDCCLTSEVFDSFRCDCDQQLKLSMKLINNNGGLIIYMPNEGRGLGYNIDGVGLIPITSEMVDNNFPATIGSTGIPLTQTMNNEDFHEAIYKCGNYTWHVTDITSNYIDKNTLEFIDINGLYSGDSNAYPNVVPTSTAFLSGCCAARAANSVIAKLHNE